MGVSGKCSAGEADGHGTGREFPPAYEFEGDLAPDCVGVGSGAPPVLVGLGCSFEALDEELLATDAPPLWICGHLVGVAALPAALELAGVEAWWVVEDGLLAGVEVGEGLVVEVVEAPGEVAVGWDAGVVPRCAGVGS